MIFNGNRAPAFDHSDPRLDGVPQRAGGRESTLPERQNDFLAAMHRRRVPPYYERLKLPFAHDMLLRCDDCRRLVVYPEMQANQGTTPCCGTRKVREVRHLKFFEWLRVRTGLLDFPYRKEFLAEFGRVKRLAPIDAKGGQEVPRA
jgi:hypothetical protein